MADPCPASSSSDPRPDCAEVIVICHGETEVHPGAMIQGQLDVELSQIGIAQATRVAETLSKERKVSAVYCSDLRRAYDTAQIIAIKCGVPRIFIDHDLTERHHGILQGLCPYDALHIYPNAYGAMISGERIAEGGESVARVSDRFTAALKRIRMNHLGQRIAVVTHGDVIKLVFKGVDKDSPSGYLLSKQVIVFHLFEHKWVIINNTSCDL